MPSEGATQPEEGTPARAHALAARERDPRQAGAEPHVTSLRLVRELAAADAAAEAEGDDPQRYAQRLLAATCAGLGVKMGALVEPDHLACLADVDLPEDVRALLEGRARSPVAASGDSLIRRALGERRVFLLGASSRDPLMLLLAESHPDVGAVAAIPLFDRDQPTAVLVLADRDGRALNPTTLRTLAIALRWLGVLLSPTRLQRAHGADGAAAIDAERYVVEIHELEARLAEAEAATRVAEERASSLGAAQRAEIESSRAHIAELEAAAARGAGESRRRIELEGERAALRAELQQRDRRDDERDERMRALEAEIEALREELAMRSAGAPGDAAERSAPDVLACDLEAGDAAPAVVAAHAVTPDAAAAASGMGGWEQSALGQIVAEAEASLADGDAGGEGSLAFDAGEEEDENLGAAPDAEDSMSASELASEADLDAVQSVAREGEGERIDSAEAAGRALLHLDSSQSACERVRELAANAKVKTWSGVGERPGAALELQIVNLFDDGLARAIELTETAPASARCFAYGADHVAGSGFELGEVAWLRRPIDAQATLARVQENAGRKLSGIVIVSHQLRELSPLRQALAEREAAGSVACDLRQALDLLEIVRRPDAILIDLTLESGQGLALAHQLRHQRETQDVPLLLLLPAEIDPVRLRADAARANLLAPYGVDEIRRLVNSALATSR